MHHEGVLLSLRSMLAIDLFLGGSISSPLRRELFGMDSSVSGPKLGKLELVYNCSSVFCNVLRIYTYIIAYIYIYTVYTVSDIILLYYTYIPICTLYYIYI